MKKIVQGGGRGGGVRRLQPGPGALARPGERPRPETEHGLIPAQSPISGRIA